MNEVRHEPGCVLPNGDRSDHRFSAYPGQPYGDDEDRAPDIALMKAVQKRLAELEDEELGELEVIVLRGVVTLVGTVADADAKHVVMLAVKEVPFVKQVEDRLAVADAGEPPARNEPTWPARQIEREDPARSSQHVHR